MAKRAQMMATKAGQNQHVFKHKKSQTPLENKSVPKEDNTVIHPSWTAKKKQKEILSNANFSGKRTVFKEID